MFQPVHVIGGGLAGSEAAWQLAQAGVPVILHEMRPARTTAAHKTGTLAELVCSNSFRSDDSLHNAVGLLHEEMRRCGSLIMRAGDAHKLPAGGALAVDRDGFAAPCRPRCEAELLVEIRREAVPALPDASSGQVIVATGPLTSPELAQSIRRVTGEDALAFFDAIAPIVHRDSIDFEVAWLQSRYDKPGPAGTGADYVNCPLDEAQYRAFVEALLRRRQARVQGVGDLDALLRGLPADRGDGGARRRHAALRADEAGRAGRSAHRPAAIRGGPAAPGQRARHAVQHGRLPDQADLRRAEAHLPHDPRAGARRVRPPGRRAPQHLHQQPAPARPSAAPQGHAAHPLRRPDHRGRGLRRERGDRPAGGPLRGRRGHGRAHRRAARHDRARRAARATSPAAPMRRRSSR